jgi:hypothetical protein
VKAMKITLEMPNVDACDVTECVYNTSKACHARAITVGDSVDPCCDTFTKSSMHVKSTTQMAGVGACKVTGCVHNADFECGAPSIRVGYVAANHVDCLTYTARA